MLKMMSRHHRQSWLLRRYYIIIFTIKKKVNLEAKDDFKAMQILSANKLANLIY